MSHNEVLEGLRVVDLTTGLAGPLAGMLLAGCGADVVKVEPPGGDPDRGRRGFQVWNRGKRAVVANPLDPGERQWLGRLIDRADVVLAGEGGPLAWPLAGGPCAGDKADPGKRAINVLLPPYLPGYTPWSGAAEQPGLVFASMGHAWNQASFDEVPVDCVYPVCSYMQGIWAAAVAVASVRARDQGGPATTVAVGGAHGALLVSPGTYAVQPGAPLDHRPGGPGGALPNYRCYRCADGTWLFLGALNLAFIDRAFAAVGATHVMEDRRVGGDPDKMRLPENIEWIIGELASVFARKPRHEWITILEAADVPVAPVLSRDIWLDDPQVAALSLRQQLTDEAGRSIVMPGFPILFGEPPWSRTEAAAARPLAVAEVGDPWPERTATSPSTLAANRLPLAGIRVVDFGTIIAGPYVGTLLAELGADVIKVERPPYGDEFRSSQGGRGGAGFSVYNRGQRGLAIDLSREDGASALRSVLASIDVVVDNFRPGVLERLGLDWASLSREHPEVVSVSISAFGGVGPLGSRPGFDPVLQAMSGIMRSQGGPSEDDNPVFLTVPINDVLASALGAFGACASLYARDRTGRGQQLQVPLTATSCLVQSEELVRVDGRSGGVLGGRDFTGPSPVDRLYQAADGWVKLAGRWPDDVKLVRAGIMDVGEAESAAGPPDPDTLAGDLTARIGALPAGDVVNRLNQAGIPAVRVRTPGEVAFDQTLVDHGILQIVASSDDGAPSAVPGHWMELAGVELGELGVAPALGEDSASILVEVGVEPDRVRHLFDAGIVIQGLF